MGVFRTIRAGDGSPEGEALRLAQERHRQRAARYGVYDRVPAAAALAEIARVIDPGRLGLNRLGDRRFAVDHDEFIRMVEVAASKGAEYVIRWGVCLPYVPLALKRPVRYGRTPKSARLSLWWGSDRDQEWPNPERRGYIGTFHGPACVRDDARRVWQASRPAAARFWECTSDLAGVLAVAAELMDAPGAANWLPLPGGVAALTAARMGRQEQARRFAAATPLSADEAAILNDLITAYAT